jgi:hypothetical protein
VVVRQRLELLGSREVAVRSDDSSSGDAPKDLEQIMKEREPIVRRLAGQRPPVPQIGRLAVKSLVAWGWGFAELGQMALMARATLVQAVCLLLVWGVIARPEAFQQAAYSLPFWHLLRGLLEEPRRMALLVVGLYVLMTLWHVNRASRYAEWAGMQGYVINERSERRWITVNVGADRGVEERQVFYIYSESEPGSGRGRLIGKLLAKEVGPDQCAGPFHPAGREMPALADFAVAFQAVKEGLIDPTAPLPERFVTVPAYLMLKMKLIS